MERIIQLLEKYIHESLYMGYDPYDYMNTALGFFKKGKWAPVMGVQLLKRLPFNIRPLLGIKKGINPKGMGLLLKALGGVKGNENGSGSLYPEDQIFSWLKANQSKGYSGAAWGYNFDWPSQNGILKAYTPSVVVTAFVGAGIHEYYLKTKDPKAKELLVSTKKFVMKDLSFIEYQNDGFFPYTQQSAGFCYNASLLGAELLARIYSVTGDKHLLEMIKKALNLVVKQQKADGHWNYSMNLKTGLEKVQIDFHQGFILCSIDNICKYAGFEDSLYREALSKGIEYYKTVQFYENGSSKWRIPKIWPVEIHNQAQGIITFSQLAYLDPSYLPFAKTIADWTIQNMQDKKGYFYYRKYRWFTNKIPFMRWSQAWMLLALVTLQNALNKKSER